MKKVFLGGTCNQSLWRDSLTPMLEIDFFNPVVEHWTEECMAQEIKERETCDFCLYTITPKSDSVYSIAEVIDDSNKRPGKTIITLLREDNDLKFDDVKFKHLKKVADMVERNGGKVFYSLEDTALYLNGRG